MFSPDDTPPVLSPELRHFATPTPINDLEQVIDRLVDIRLHTHIGPSQMSKLIGNKGIILQLFYTRCRGVCPGTTAMLKTVAKQLGPRVGNDIVVLSLSLDAERGDTGGPQALCRIASPAAWLVHSILFKN